MWKKCRNLIGQIFKNRNKQTQFFGKIRIYRDIRRLLILHQIEIISLIRDLLSIYFVDGLIEYIFKHTTYFHRYFQKGNLLLLHLTKIYEIA